jgi:(p)ppGpp synthase/HD superfamily hydrolase
MSVAAMVLENGGGEDVAIAGLLHDAVEDSDDGSAMEARIRREFGDRVADIVAGCSDAIAVPGQKKSEWRGRKENYLNHLRAETNGDVLLVSACDKLHNARAIVADLRDPNVGSAVWKRFSRGKNSQLWYYGCLATAYNGRVNSGLSDELNRVVMQMGSLAAGIDFAIRLAE